jgi:hypothetical protein
MVPEFISNAQEARHLIDNLGAINFRAYYPGDVPNNLWRIPLEPRMRMESIKPPDIEPV